MAETPPAVATIPSVPGNPLNFDCDWRYGLNLKTTQKATVGYLLEWNGCGGLSLQKDIEVFNPCSPDRRTVVTSATVKCIGLIERFAFEGGDNDPIRISAYLSKGMASEVQATLARPLSTTKVKVGWLVIDYDDERKQWYEAAYCKTPTKAEANIDSAEGELQLSIDTEPTRVSPSLDLNVFKFEFQIVPADGKKNQLQFATGPTRKIVSMWSGG